ncbi:DNA gyrase subunit A, partial [Staphylococcus succinus]|uniref:DNA gyrase C-terminal beta-propeller domain-containing protein n=1 Tax=Staphylococcus succinus TaxID=61015 RepID=UPI000D4900CB
VAYAESEDEVLVVTEKGYGKRTPVSEYRLSKRGGKGRKTAKITERNGNVVCITTVRGQEDLMIVTDGGIIIRLQVEDISQNGRATQGVRLMKLGDNQAVSTVAKVIDKTEDEAATEAAQQTEHASAQTTESANEQVIDDTTPGNALHTESDEDDERIEVRQDVMD